MSNVIHKTVRVKVWADIDEGVADMVRYLNTLPGVTTHASCQGTIGEGGPHPYRPFVSVSCTDPDMKERLLREFELDEERNGHFFICPRMEAESR